jgi:TonB-dependent receptor
VEEIVSKFTSALHNTVALCTLSWVIGTACAFAADEPATNPNGDEEATQEVVVTGIRHAIETATEEKRNSGSIIEAITAEDIGKLPDTSIAESISRLPGLTSQRANGRASAISLRGTDPAFTSALLNGREQVSTGDNRSVEFDQYPSELLSAVVVYKTPDARLVGQGLAGTIDLRTQRPLDYGKRAIVLNLRGERNSNNDLGADSKDDGYRASFSYIDQFADDKFGVTFGYARLDSPLAIAGVGAYEPWHPNTVASDGFNFHPSIPVGVYVTNGMKVRADMGKNVRDGAMAALQWKPNDSFASILDLYYTKSKETDDARSLEWNLGNYPATTDYSNLVIRNNTLIGATVANVRPLARNFQFTSDDEIIAAGLNNRWESPSSDWVVSGDISYSRATRDQFQPETNAQFGTCAGGGDAACLDIGQFQFSGGKSFPVASFTLNYADPTQVAFGPTIYGAGYVKKPHIEDELKSVRIDVSRKLGMFFDSLAAGINFADRGKDKESPEANLNTLSPGAVFIDSQFLEDPTNLSYGGLGGALAWDVPGVIKQYYQPIVYGDPSTLTYLVGKFWAVDEKVTTGYVRSDLNYELSPSVSLKGNLGVQLVRTDQNSDSQRLNSVLNTIESFSDGKKYTDVLPALNFAFILPQDQAVRIGLAREIARARMDQLKASSEIGCDRGTGLCGGDAGNSRLDPWRADAYDLSYEKYFNSAGGYFSAAVFMKKLKSYIFNATDADHDFSDFIAGLPSDYFVDPSIVDPLGSFTQPVNGHGGTIKGAELSVSLPGEMFSEGLSGFGTILSISQTQSGIKVVDLPGTNTTSGTGFGQIPLPGLSKTVWNATVYYEKRGFSARVATRARSKYIGEIPNFANDRAFRFVKGDQITDMQLGYEFGDGRLGGLSLLFQVNNLTNEPYVAYALEEARVIDYQTYGRQFLFGLNYKM